MRAAFVVGIVGQPPPVSAPAACIGVLFMPCRADATLDLPALVTELSLVERLAAMRLLDRLLTMKPQPGVGHSLDWEQGSCHELVVHRQIEQRPASSITALSNIAELYRGMAPSPGADWRGRSAGRVRLRGPSATPRPPRRDRSLSSWSDGGA